MTESHRNVAVATTSVPIHPIVEDLRPKAATLDVTCRGAYNAADYRSRCNLNCLLGAAVKQVGHA